MSSTADTDDAGDAGSSIPTRDASPPPPPPPAPPPRTDDTYDGPCSEYKLRATSNTPQIVVVLDRSLSMSASRWPRAVEAVKAVTARFENDIAFGLLLFPEIGSAGCTADSMAVPIRLQNGAAIDALLSETSPAGNTPTAAALRTAHAALGELPDETAQAAPRYIVLITDGAPNCGGAGGMEEAMVTESIHEISALAEDDVKTYVLGYNIFDAIAKRALDRMAAAGGTGDTAYREITDRPTLEAQFKQIAGAARSCELELESPVGSPEHVDLRIDGARQLRDDANGWRLGEDLQSVTLQGKACRLLRDGEPHDIAIEEPCSPVW